MTHVTTPRGTTGSRIRVACHLTLATLGLAAVLSACGSGPASPPEAGTGGGGGSQLPDSHPTATPHAGSTAPGTLSSGASDDPTAATRTKNPGGVEVQPDPPGSSPSTLPGITSTPGPSKAPLISTPLPSQASAHGAFVAGYPRRVVPGAPRSRVLVSSVSPSGSRLQTALTSHSPGRVPRIERFYRAHLSRIGFREATPTIAGPATTLTFHRGADSVVLTLNAQHGVRYTLFASLSA